MRKLVLLVVGLLLLNMVSAVTVFSDDCSTQAAPGWTFNSVTQNSGYWLLDDNADFVVSEVFGAYDNLVLVSNLRSFGTGSAPSCFIEVSTDGGSTWTGVSTTFSSIPNSYTDYIFNIGTLSGSNNVIRWSRSAGTRGLRINDLELTGDVISGGFTVTFLANAGSGSMSPQTESSTTALTTNTFTRSGFTFAGWTTASDSTGTFYADGANYSFTSDLTLYAQWTVNSGGSSCVIDLDFENAGGYTTSVAENIASSTDYFGRTLESSIAATFTNDDGFFFAAQDIDGAVSGSTQTLSIDDVNIVGYTDLEFSIDLAEDDDGSSEDWDNADFFHIEYRLDNGAWQNLLWVESSGGTNTEPQIDTDFDGDGDGTAITDAFATFLESIAGTGSEIDILITINLNSGDEDIAFDNVTLCGTTGAPAPEIQVVDASSNNQACGAFTLDFGTLAPSASNDLTFDIENVGAADLTISSFSGLSGTDFSIISPSTPFTLTASSSQTVTVRYTGNATIGTVNETLTINNDDSDEGTCSVALTGTSSNALTIPDDGCPTFVSSTFNYAGGGGNIDDINVFVSVTHTFRSDLQIEVESPAGTTVQLFDGSNSGGEDNLEVNFDDEGSAITSNAHTVDGTADEDVTSDIDLLSLFDGENPTGNWTIRICDAFAGDVGQLEDWNVIVTEVCTPTQTVSSLIPSTGPEGTEVSITGTGFTGSTSVSVGGTAAAILSQSATELVIEIPSGASTGNIVVTENACDLNGGTFTILDESSCTSGSSNFTDLIISELYDAEAGNQHYIELFNGTSNNIDLSDYELQILDAGGNNQNPRLEPTGILAPGEVHVFAFGAASYNECPSFDQANTINTNLGINEDSDGIELYKNGTFIDFIDIVNEVSSGSPGFSINRVGSASGPTTTYNSADWTSNLSETCTDLGTAPTTITALNPPTIDSPLSDYNSCELDMSISASPGEGGTLTYQWFYTDNVSAGWTAVSNSSPAGLTISGETTNNLTISTNSNSTSSIDSFQFYVEVTEDAACSKVTNAAKYTIGGERFFRSKTSGDWNDLATWEMSTSSAGPTWIDACILPDAANSDYIEIVDGHQVDISETGSTPDVSADEVVINGTLEIIDPNAEFEIPNGTGIDLQIGSTGTFIDNSNSGGGNGPEFASGATWNIVSGGTLIKTNTGSATTYRDNYESGIASIPANANWIYRFTGSTIAIANSASGNPMFYPNLTFESTSGNHDFDALTECFTGRLEVLTIKGDLTIGGNGNAVKVFNNNFNPTPIQVLGDLYVEAGSELTNEGYDVVNGNYDVQWREGAGFEFYGDLLVEGILDVSHFAPGSASSSGRVVPGTEGVIFSKSGSTQDVIGDTGESFISNDVSINTTENVELSDIDMQVEDNLIFTTGKIITTITSPDKVYITNSSTAAISGGVTSGASNYVEGKLQWTTDGSSAYTFPIGHSTQNAQGFTIGVNGSNGSDILGYLEANATATTEAFAYCDLETHPGGGTVNAGNGNAGYDGILDAIEFNLESPLQWDITNPGGGISTYDLAVLANGGQDISPVTTVNGLDVRFLMKNGEPGNTGVATGQGLPSFTANGFLSCPNQYTLNGLNSFSKFTLNGATQTNTTLPIELLYFKAEAQENQTVFCSWETATEINNDYFSLERSADGEWFEPIGVVEGAGNHSGTLAYGFVDEEALFGISYYRLRQTDFDGTSTISQIVPVSFSRNETSFEVYPQPFESVLNIENTEGLTIEYELFDLSGKSLVSGTFIGVLNLDLSSFAKGSYFIRLHSNDTSKTIKVLKK